jgi:hypothetical protein
MGREIMKLCFYLLLTLPTLSLAAPKATFSGSYLRYLSGHDVFRLLAQKFPRAEWGTLKECSRLTDQNRNVLGVATPANGQVTYPAPSVTYAKWYFKCLLSGIEKDLGNSVSTSAGKDRFFGRETNEKLSAQSSNVLTAPKEIAWATLSDAMQTTITVHLIHQLIGPNVVRDEGELAQKLLGATQRAGLSTYDALKKLVLLVSSQDEFLTY